MEQFDEAKSKTVQVIFSPDTYASLSKSAGRLETSRTAALRDAILLLDRLTADYEAGNKILIQRHSTLSEIEFKKGDT